MDIFSQKKILVRTVAILILINVCSIGFFVWKDSGHSGEPELFPSNDYRDVSGVLKKELNLTDEQVLKIDVLRKDFYEKEKALAIVMKAERDSMNKDMFNKNPNDSAVISLAKSVSEKEYSMELLRIEQARQLRGICTPEQLAKFEKLVKEIRDYFRPNNQPKKK